MKQRAIVIGDSTNNTLSVVRSLGEANIEQILILKCETDICFVANSKYLKHAIHFQIKQIEECLPILKSLKSKEWKQSIICTFDEAAEFIDENEGDLFPTFLTPARGYHINKLFNKRNQCKLAESCGLTVPKSYVLDRSKLIDRLPIEFPVLLKPLYSTKGEKSDIHICRQSEDIQNSLAEASKCHTFLLQEFIEKEYELDCIGVRTENEVFIAGAVKKIRHYPELIGAGAYGLFVPISKLNINEDGIKHFLEQAHYYGPFSIEFLHRGKDNYFMEVNFRNEGLAYVATAAGANLHAMYINPAYKVDKSKIKDIYMMNYSIDFLYVKSGKLSLTQWLVDFFKTRCFININLKDLYPTILHYKSKLLNKTNMI